MIKFLHAADFHLDSAFSALSAEQSAQRRREQRTALDALAKLCADCDLVLLSGDLFDSARVYRDTLDALKRFFAAVPAEIFIAPGNHDFLASGSPYLTENWGENVHIFTAPEITRIHLPKLDCDVYGGAFTAPEMPDFLHGFRAEDPATPSFMVLHGDLAPNSPYAPISPDDVAASGLDYLALGHVHATEVRKLGGTTCAYPGCLMGRGFDECGAKGVLRGTLENGACNLEFVPLPTRKYEILSVEVGEDALAAIRAALPDGHEADCYRILLTGESDGVDVAALEAALSPEFFSLSVRDRTVPRKTLWADAEEDTLRGQFLRVLKAEYDGADEAQRQKLARAARLVTALMDGREVSL